MGAIKLATGAEKVKPEKWNRSYGMRLILADRRRAEGDRDGDSPRRMEAQDARDIDGLSREAERSGSE